MSIKVIIADDHQLFRAGLKSLLMMETGIEVIGEAANGRELLKIAAERKPDIVIVDISMPEMNGIEAAQQLTSGRSGIKVIALSMHKDLNYVKGMLNAGASGYILKDSAYEELSLALSMVSANQTYLSPQISDVIAKDYVRHISGKKGAESNHSLLSVLSSREREVLQLIAEGRATRDIADILNVSVKTIETHRQKVMNKLDIHSVAELTKFAIRQGLTSLE